MNARNELAERVFDLLTVTQNVSETRLHVIAHAIALSLLDAGWSKPRTVDSIEELQALKSGTVLRFPDGEIGMIMVTHDKRHVIGYPGILPTAELADASQHCFGDGLAVLFTPVGEG